MAEKLPVVDIHIAESSIGSRITVNGEDISGCVSRVVVECDTEHLSKVTLFVHRLHLATVKGAVEVDVREAEEDAS